MISDLLVLSKNQIVNHLYHNAALLIIDEMILDGIK